MSKQTAAGASAKSDESTKRLSQADNKIHYDELTAFGDPVPKDRDFATASSFGSDEEGEALLKNPFLDPDVADHWATVYEKSQYECRHVFDPTLAWTEEEENKLVVKLDWHVCLWAVSSIINGHFCLTTNNFR